MIYTISTKQGIYTIDTTGINCINFNNDKTTINFWGNIVEIEDPDSKHYDTIRQAMAEDAAIKETKDKLQIKLGDMAIEANEFTKKMMMRQSGGIIS